MDNLHKRQIVLIAVVVCLAFTAGAGLGFYSGTNVHPHSEVGSPTHTPPHSDDHGATHSDDHSPTHETAWLLDSFSAPASNGWGLLSASSTEGAEWFTEAWFDSVYPQADSLWVQDREADWFGSEFSDVTPCLWQSSDRTAGTWGWEYAGIRKASPRGKAAWGNLAVTSLWLPA